MKTTRKMRTPSPRAGKGLMAGASRREVRNNAQLNQGPVCYHMSPNIDEEERWLR
jgi:hypothetical protein